MAFSKLAMPSLNMFLMCVNVSSDFPLKKSNFPKNFCSSSLIDAISLAPMWKGIASGQPAQRDSDLHLEGLSFIPIEDI